MKLSEDLCKDIDLYRVYYAQKKKRRKKKMLDKIDKIKRIKSMSRSRIPSVKIMHRSKRHENDWKYRVNDEE